MSIYYLLIVILGFTGFFIAFIVGHKKKKAEPMVCPLKANCEEVIHSKYSTFLGIPLEYLGMAYYALIALAYTVFIAMASIAPEIIFLALGISLGAVIFSLYLVGIQAFVLKEWCSWCLISAALSIIIFVLSAMGLEIDLPAFLTEYKTIIIILHSAAAGIGVGVATVTDVLFFKYLKDYKISHFESNTMKILSQMIWFALGLLVVTGLGLFISDMETLMHSSKFLLKVMVVFTLIGNGILLNLIIQPRLVHISFGEPHHHIDGELSILRKYAFAFGSVSIVSWYITFILGSLRSIPVTFGEGIMYYLGLLFIVITGSQIFEHLVSHRKV